MNIVINEVEYCKLVIQYEADGDTVSLKKSEVINKFREQKVPGFRPGKATAEAIKQHYRKEINEALKHELAEDAVHNVIFEKNIKPFGRPEFSYINLEESYMVNLNGESAIPKFKCEFSMNKQPDFELAKYKEFDIPKPGGFIPVEELTQRMIQDLRTKYGETTAYGEDDFVQMGDTVIIDYKASIDGVVIDKLTGNGEILNVGRINVPGFSESLLGMKPAESREFDLTMPENHPDYPSKTLHMEVKISTGSKVAPAPMNDELATRIGVKSFDELMESVRSTATSRVVELEKNHNMDQISKRLVENHEFKIPSWVSTAEAQINSKNSGHEWDSIPDEEKEKYIDTAEKSIKLSLILQRIRENEPDAQLTDEEVFETAKQNLAKFSPEPEKVMNEIFKNGHLPILFNRIRDEHALDFIQKTCTFIE